MTNENSTKPQPSTKTVPLVERLLEIARSQDRGTLAALRTGLGKPPGTAVRMFPIVAPYLHGTPMTGSDSLSPEIAASFIVAALFAKHPEHRPGPSLGDALRRSISGSAAKHGERGVEMRLTAALDADPEDLPRHLEGLVSLCQSAGQPLDWHRFFWHVAILLGDDEDRRNRVRLAWARDFWKHAQENPSEEKNQ
ncbi:MAG: type I-E CRISPR-associated protein Cse2/CasB [Fimbriimonadales bacterium]|nr:type I-E CRISPR-associated protein Cse2/CasB [Fimbriimonadales bacterium]